LASLLDGERASDLIIPVPSKPPAGGQRRSGRMGLVSQELKCAQAPTEAPRVDNHYYTLETEHAAKLGVTYIGTGSLDLDKKMKVYVREYSRYNTCTATDGKTELRYGAVWRATVLIDETDASASVNFAVVAASATLRNVSVQVLITHDGFDDTDRVGIDEASQAAMEATKDGLNVASFVKFSEAVEKAIKTTINAKVRTPMRVIGVKREESGGLREAVARTLALAYIAKGRTAADAIAALRGGPRRVPAGNRGDLQGDRRRQWRRERQDRSVAGAAADRRRKDSPRRLVLSYCRSTVGASSAFLLKVTL
jgi:hypothetical protein